MEMNEIDGVLHPNEEIEKLLNWIYETEALIAANKIFLEKYCARYWPMLRWRHQFYKSKKDLELSRLAND